jgi:hypothetical protein
LGQLDFGGGKEAVSQATRIEVIVQKLAAGGE